MSTMNHVIEDPEKEYDPTHYVPQAHSHGKKEVWMVFYILLFLTLIDVAIYFTFHPSTARHLTFIALGVLKGFYIVGTFMHLKYEIKNLVLTILLPLILVVYLIALIIHEGGAIELSNYIQ
ncbi:MAG: cytochrome C oxidase subunit IV family protein [Bacteroidia bacterium]|nr:cytochrome C oxidase subunit IV family protein [Bacteroidia bacterium]